MPVARRRDVHGDDRSEQGEGRQHPRPLVRAQHDRHERRDRDVHAEEPERLADAEARRRHELGGQARECERGESAGDDDHERDRRTDEPFEAGADVLGRRRPARRIDRQWWKLEKPPAMKNSGMICTTQLTGPNQACSSSAFSSTGPPAPTLTPHIMACSANTATSSTMRIASTLGSRTTPRAPLERMPRHPCWNLRACRSWPCPIRAAHPPTRAG